ncbi:hypothetical protein DES53_103255 [Roseimicrobium gellanilyticum]|uniref:Uncharacterized protein n=1 Tax=Roseimicrobium gellanilyticum TaxID=748857 RepID=A0A366HP41_9BACT|nr:hypothetical protein [Roseimicrobium gellanilyticum]RBP45257.1 hypothetical protein DES53_103255 [Roseimicrobium gellanilyticum]
MAAMQPKPAWKTYLMVTLAIFPTLLTWLFWVTIIAPKISHQWDKIAADASFQDMSHAIRLMAYWSIVFGCGRDSRDRGVYFEEMVA